MADPRRYAVPSAVSRHVGRNSFLEGPYRLQPNVTKISTTLRLPWRPHGDKLAVLGNCARPAPDGTCATSQMWYGAGVNRAKLALAGLIRRCFLGRKFTLAPHAVQVFPGGLRRKLSDISLYPQLAANFAPGLYEFFQGQSFLPEDLSYLVKGASLWVQNWQVRGWQTRDGKPLANREEWRALLEAARLHPGSAIQPAAT